MTLTQVDVVRPLDSAYSSAPSGTHASGILPTLAMTTCITVAPPCIRARPSTAVKGHRGKLGGCRRWIPSRSARGTRPCAASIVELAQIAADTSNYWTKYAFMFPVSVCVATTAMLTGIGGAALFSPIFLLGFPILGPEYPLDSAAEAFNVALLTECFGFTSGLIGYTNRGLVDWRVSAPFIAVGVPAGIAGGLSVASADPGALRLGYGAMMAALGTYLAAPRDEDGACDAGDVDDMPEECLTLTDNDGETYAYQAPAIDAAAIAATALGGALTGLLSVGIGESVVPQLTRRGDAKLPLAVAAGTSVSVVIVVALAAAAAQASVLYGGDAPVAFEFPRNLVCFTVPGVICGGQIGPRLQGSIAQRDAERALGLVFVCVGAAFLKAGLSHQ